MLALIIINLAISIFILSRMHFKHREQVQQLGKSSPGPTSMETTTSSLSTQKLCKKVHTLAVNLVFEHEPYLLVIEFPHESWASTFHSCCQDWGCARAGNPPLPPLSQSRHYSKHFVSILITDDVKQVQMKRPGGGLVIVFQHETPGGRELGPSPWWHWSKASFLWKSNDPMENRRELRQVWSHEEFDATFRPLVLDIRRQSTRLLRGPSLAVRDKGRTTMLDTLLANETEREPRSTGLRTRSSRKKVVVVETRTPLRPSAPFTPVLNSQLSLSLSPSRSSSPDSNRSSSSTARTLSSTAEKRSKSKSKSKSRALWPRGLERMYNRRKKLAEKERNQDDAPEAERSRRSRRVDESP